MSFDWKTIAVAAVVTIVLIVVLKKVGFASKIGLSDSFEAETETLA